MTGYLINRLHENLTTYYNDADQSTVASDMPIDRDVAIEDATILIHRLKETGNGSHAVQRAKRVKSILAHTDKMPKAGIRKVVGPLISEVY